MNKQRGKITSSNNDITKARMNGVILTTKLGARQAKSTDPS